MLDKILLRKEYISKRNLILREFSGLARIEAVFFTLLENIQKVSNVAGYYPTNQELDIRPLLLKLKEKSYNILLPRLLPENKMEFVRWNGKLQATPHFDSKEPPEGTIVIPDIAIIPLICCDRWGNRIGYGKGYYDRYLAANQKIIKVALIPEELIVNEPIHTESHDIKLNYIVTENELIAIS